MSISETIKQNSFKYAPIFQFELSKASCFELDFSVNNKELYEIELSDTNVLSEYIKGKLNKNNKSIGIGGYLENRLIYKRSEHFGSGKDSRSIHLGIDIWSKEGTPIFTFADSVVHSFKINDNFGDYGPTIILKHKIENQVFYTLYGHLSISSLNNLYEGKKIPKNHEFATLGNSDENGNWPPHLHFQIITDMQNKKGDFYGVCSPSEIDKYQLICPNPNLILNYG